ncbi:MAG: NYN domain-containing protein [Myxococcota bacterium]
MSKRVRRAAFFIDGSNFFKTCEGLRIYTYQLEWDRFLRDLAGPREIAYANYYDAMKNQREVPTQYRKQQRFHAILRRIAWMDIRLGRLERRPDGRGSTYIVEKGVDTRLAIDLVVGAVRDRYDDAYLLSADGFSYAVEEVMQTPDKKVFVATPGRSFHLAQAAHGFIPLTPARLRGYLRKRGP